MKNFENRSQKSEVRNQSPVICALSPVPYHLFTFLLAFLLLPSAFLSAAPVTATAKTVSGKVEWSAGGGGKYESLSSGQSLGMGSTIRTGSDGVAIVATVPGAAVRVGPGSVIVLNELDFAKSGEKITNRKAVLDLKSGTVSALIEHNAPETTSFIIKTPQGIAAARGTFFAVSVADGQAHVAVKEGKVGLQKYKPKEATPPPTDGKSESK